MKTFLFTGGFPRSGSTLLTTILNQNPNIFATNGTNMARIFETLDREFPLLDPVRRGENLEGYDNLLNNLYPSFFSHIKQNIIIDKLNWTAEPKDLISTMETCNKNYKAVLTTRPVLEILASFILLCQKTPQVNFIDKAMEETNFAAMKYKNLDDARCDWLMKDEGFIQKPLYFLDFISKNKLGDHFLVIDYDELVTNSSSTIHKIYDFYEIEKYQHDTTNLAEEDFKQQDFEVYGMPTLHSIKKTITKSTTNYKEVLSSYVIKKYGG